MSKTKMPLAKQATAAPTRKLTAAIAAAAAVALIQVTVHNLAPSWDQPYLWPPLIPVAAYIAGYFIKDRANIPVSDSTVEE